MITVPIEKVQNELNFLKQLLGGIGFSFINEAKDTKVIIDRASRYFLTHAFEVCIDKDVIGECVLIVPSSRPAKVNIVLNPITIPEKIITELLLFGFEVEANNWLEYEIVIK